MRRRGTGTRTWGAGWVLLLVAACSGSERPAVVRPAPVPSATASASAAASAPVKRYVLVWSNAELRTGPSDASPAIRAASYDDKDRQLRGEVWPAELIEKTDDWVTILTLGGKADGHCYDPPRWSERLRLRLHVRPQALAPVSARETTTVFVDGTWTTVGAGMLLGPAEDSPSGTVHLVDVDGMRFPVGAAAHGLDYQPSPRFEVEPKGSRASWAPRARVNGGMRLPGPSFFGRVGMPAGRGLAVVESAKIDGGETMRVAQRCLAAELVVVAEPKDKKVAALRGAREFGMIGLLNTAGWGDLLGTGRVFGGGSRVGGRDKGLPVTEKKTFPAGTRLFWPNEDDAGHTVAEMKVDVARRGEYWCMPLRAGKTSTSEVVVCFDDEGRATAAEPAAAAPVGAPARPKHAKPSVAHARCRASDGCDALGLCSAAEDGRCIAATGYDCAVGSALQYAGRHCTAIGCLDLQGGVCKSFGWCRAAGGVCRAAAGEDCQTSLACTGLGWCEAKDGACGTWSDADCAARPACPERGACKSVAGQCVAADAAACTGSEVCRKYGMCAFEQGACVVHDDADCKRSEPCKRQAWCTALDRRHSRLGDKLLPGPPSQLPDSGLVCAPTCAKLFDCQVHGLCARDGRRCVAQSPVHCARSERCKQDGRCQLDKGRCVVKGDADCRRSQACTERGRCSASNGSCVVKSPADCRRSRACKYLGHCTPSPGQGCLSSGGCANTPACKKDGTCAFDPSHAGPDGIMLGRCVKPEEAVEVEEEPEE